MSGERLSKIESLFAAATKLDPRQRAAYMAEACGADENLRAQIEARLAADSAADSIETAEMSSIGESASAHLGPGTRLGPYQLEVL